VHIGLGVAVKGMGVGGRKVGVETGVFRMGCVGGRDVLAGVGLAAMQPEMSIRIRRLVDSLCKMIDFCIEKL